MTRFIKSLILLLAFGIINQNSLAISSDAQKKLKDLFNANVNSATSISEAIKSAQEDLDKLKKSLKIYEDEFTQKRDETDFTGEIAKALVEYVKKCTTNLLLENQPKYLEELNKSYIFLNRASSDFAEKAKEKLQEINDNKRALTIIQKIEKSENPENLEITLSALDDYIEELIKDINTNNYKNDKNLSKIAEIEISIFDNEKTKKALEKETNFFEKIKKLKSNIYDKHKEKFSKGEKGKEEILQKITLDDMTQVLKKGFNKNLYIKVFGRPTEPKIGTDNFRLQATKGGSSLQVKPTVEETYIENVEEADIEKKLIEGDETLIKKVSEINQQIEEIMANGPYSISFYQKWIAPSHKTSQELADIEERAEQIKNLQKKRDKYAKKLINDIDAKILKKEQVIQKIENEKRTASKEDKERLQLQKTNIQLQINSLNEEKQLYQKPGLLSKHKLMLITGGVTLVTITSIVIYSLYTGQNPIEILQNTYNYSTIKAQETFIWIIEKIQKLLNKELIMKAPKKQTLSEYKIIDKNTISKILENFKKYKEVKENLIKSSQIAYENIKNIEMPYGLRITLPKLPDDLNTKNIQNYIEDISEIAKKINDIKLSELSETTKEAINQNLSYIGETCKNMQTLNKTTSEAVNATIETASEVIKDTNFWSNIKIATGAIGLAAIGAGIQIAAGIIGL